MNSPLPKKTLGGCEMARNKSQPQLLFSSPGAAGCHVQDVWCAVRGAAAIGFNEVFHRIQRGFLQPLNSPTNTPTQRGSCRCWSENEAPESQLYAELEGEQVGIDLLSSKQQEKLESGIPRRKLTATFFKGIPSCGLGVCWLPKKRLHTW